MKFANMVLPKMIVFDLDYCLWTPEMYTLNEKPSIPKLNTNGLVIGMQVPQGPTVSLFPGARKVLEHLHSERETTYKGESQYSSEPCGRFPLSYFTKPKTAPLFARRRCETRACLLFGGTNLLRFLP